MSQFISVVGVVSEIESQGTNNSQTSDCSLKMTVVGKMSNVTNFILTLNTVFIDNSTIRKGDRVIAFYDTNQAVPLIFPPQYQAVVVAKQSAGHEVVVDTFDDNLLNSSNTLKLNVNLATPILLPNNQKFLGTITNRPIAAVYSSTSRSIPPVATPSKIIVLCR